MKASMERLISVERVDVKQERPSRAATLARAAKPATAAAATPPEEQVPDKPPELSWPDFLNLLLAIGSEIEHSLMVEYLYAAYSLGGDEVPKQHREKVERWRSHLLTIAREEMGHLLTVQNLRCLLGAPVTFERDDYPFDAPFYPFPFKLQPLTLDSLSCYVYAEAPSEAELRASRNPRYVEFLQKDWPRIRLTVRRLAHGKPHRVGSIYEDILAIIRRTDLIPDSSFNRGTLTRQASFADWGRNYQPAPRDVDAEGSLLKAAPSWKPRVIVTPMATRTEAIAALQDVAGQGEAPHLRDDKDKGGDRLELSHFDRFLEIYQDYMKYVGSDASWSPARNVPENPTAGVARDGKTPILGPARTWGHLFNVRYRMLLAYLAHSYRLPPKGRVDEPNLRGTVIHRAFGEMYNLKSIAGLLVNMPLGDAKRRFCAAPPFEIPYTIALPETEADCWLLHRDLLTTSQSLCATLAPEASGDAARYLATLGDLDTQAIGWADQILAGLGVSKRRSA